MIGFMVLIALMMNRIICAMRMVLIAACMLMAMVMVTMMMVGMFVAMNAIAMMDVVRIGFRSGLRRDSNRCCGLRRCDGRFWGRCGRCGCSVCHNNLAPNSFFWF